MIPSQTAASNINSVKKHLHHSTLFCEFGILAQLNGKLPKKLMREKEMEGEGVGKGEMGEERRGKERKKEKEKEEKEGAGTLISIV